MRVGAAVVSAATCLAVLRWVACGQRGVGRVVTVAGPRAAYEANVWVPFGTSCLELAGETDGAVIHGGPMSGARCTAKAVVTAATAAVLALDATPAPLPGPCIRCGWCTDHCPARLPVAALNDAFELSLVDRARLYQSLLPRMRLAMYDAVAPFLRRQVDDHNARAPADKAIDFDKAFPAPEGLEEHRKKTPSPLRPTPP